MCNSNFRVWAPKIYVVGKLFFFIYVDWILIKEQVVGSTYLSRRSFLGGGELQHTSGGEPTPLTWTAAGEVILAGEASWELESCSTTLGGELTSLTWRAAGKAS